MQRFVSDKRTKLSIEAVQHSGAELQADANRMERLREQDRQAHRERQEREQQEREQQLVRHVGMRNPSDRELLMATLLAVPSAQIQDLKERVALMELGNLQA